MLLQSEEEELLEPQDSPPTSSSPIDEQSSSLLHHDQSSSSHHLSFNALKGTDAVGTIHFRGMINGHAVQILLDGGSSDNYISPRLAHFLKLPIKSTANFKVMVGNGHYLISEGQIKALTVYVQGHSICLPFFLLPIAGSDLVFGAAWLATIGPHVADYSTATMKLYLNGDFITLQGERSAKPVMAQYNHLKRLKSTDAIAELFMLKYFHLEYDTWLPLPPDSPDDLALILNKFKPVFDLPKGLPPTRFCDHHISLHEGTAPVRVKPYRYPFSKKTEIEKIVQQMLDDGIIRPSSSPFSAPVIIVKKKDGTWRFCTDYRALNAITIKDSFPILTVDKLLDELFGAVYFSKLDLRLGYHQILVALEDRHKTAFRTHNGHYEWLVMPFVLTNVPATFQTLMNDVFWPYLRKFVLVFFDDILIYSQIWDMHLQHLTVVLDLLLSHQFFAKLSKCSFGQTRIDYLDHFVSAKGVEMDPSKVQAMLNWPPPTIVKQLRAFLGLTGYYRRFIRRYANIAVPLTTLLQKGEFLWSTEAQIAFESLKQSMTSAPILRLPNFSKPFIIETDARVLVLGTYSVKRVTPLHSFLKRCHLSCNVNQRMPEKCMRSLK